MAAGNRAKSRRFKVLGETEVPALVEEALLRAGWERTEEDDWTLGWSVDVLGSSAYAALAPGQFLNHLPGIALLTSKDGLATLARDSRARLRARGVQSRLSVPRTFLMPLEYEALQVFAHEHPNIVWIEKPKASARGEGVSLVSDVRWVETDPNWLVQEYLARPHLIDGFKYTLRCYCLITGLDPLTLYVFDDGFTKFASRRFGIEPWQRADRFRHLTNPDVLARDPSNVVSGRNLTRPAYASLLRDQGHDPDLLFSRITDIAVELVSAGREHLSRASRQAGGVGGNCFELLGLDVLVDEELTPWLIECNLSPSLSVEADDATGSFGAERDLKERLVRSTLEVVGLIPATAGNGLERNLPGGSIAAMALPRLADLEAAGETLTSLRPATGISERRLDDSLVLHLPASDSVHVLDPLAAYMWSAWVDGLGPEEIAGELLESFPGAAGQALDDVWNALGSWVELGLAVSTDQATSSETRPQSALPFIEWNRARVYELLGTRIGVLTSDMSSEAWIDAALADLQAHEPVDWVAAHLEVQHEPGVWTVIGPQARTPCVSERQLGPAVRATVIRIAADATSGAALRATVLKWPDRPSVLLTGGSDARAQLARAAIADGAQCLADDLVALARGDDGEPELIGWQLAIEETLAANWYGDLPDVSDPEGPVVVTGQGTFSRYWRAARDDEAPVRTKPAVCICISPGDPIGARFAPLPERPAGVLVELLTSRAGSSERISDVNLGIAVDLASTMRGFRTFAGGEPQRSVEVIRDLASLVE